MKMSRLFSRKNAPRDLFSYDGLHLAYVTEKEDAGETVLGKDGFVSVTSERLALLCGQATVFLSKTDGVEASELLSGNGVLFTGFDETCSRERTVIAYFSYHRK